MSAKIFDRDGTLHFPGEGGELLPPRPQPRPEYSVTRIFCRHGHNLITIDHPVGDKPGIHLRFVRPNREAGEVVISPVLGSLEKILLSGKLVDGEQVTLQCPVCRENLDVLCHCEFHPDSPVCLLYLTPDVDVESAIAICSIVGCPNSSYRHAGDMVRGIRTL